LNHGLTLAWRYRAAREMLPGTLSYSLLHANDGTQTVQDGNTVEENSSIFSLIRAR